LEKSQAEMQAENTDLAQEIKKKNNLSRELSLPFLFHLLFQKINFNLFYFSRPFLQRIKFLKKQLTKT
jgi:hypothetical protein